MVPKVFEATLCAAAGAFTVWTYYQSSVLPKEDRGPLIERVASVFLGSLNIDTYSDLRLLAQLPSHQATTQAQDRFRREMDKAADVKGGYFTVLAKGGDTIVYPVKLPVPYKEGNTREGFVRMDLARRTMSPRAREELLDGNMVRCKNILPAGDAVVLGSKTCHEFAVDMFRDTVQALLEGQCCSSRKPIPDIPAFIKETTEYQRIERLPLPKGLPFTVCLAEDNTLQGVLFGTESPRDCQEFVMQQLFKQIQDSI